MGLYQRPESPYWWYRFTVNGGRFRGSTGEVSKQIAKTVEAVEHARASLARPGKGKWRVSTLTGTYLDVHGQFLASAYTVTYQLERLTAALGPATFLADLTNKHVIDYRARQRATGLANASINREIALLHSCINFAHLHYDQPLPNIKWKGLLLAEPDGRKRFLSTTEYQALIAACDDELRATILVAVSTGLRRDNIEAMDWSQVNLDQARIGVTLKGGDLHTVKLNKAVIAALARTKPADRTGPVFKMPNKRKRWEKARADAKLVDFRFHDLRHTFASWARLAGADIASICEAMHHSDVKMTMRYAHLTPDSELTAFDAVAVHFSPRVARSVTQRRPKKALTA